MGKSKRKIPTFRLSITENVNYDYIATIPEIKEAVMEETVNAIKDGVYTKKKKISLFSLANSDYYIELEKRQWKLSLQHALDYYVKTEDYNKCIECRDLIQKLSYEQNTRRTHQ